jgi:hypothetical protein
MTFARYRAVSLTNLQPQTTCPGTGTEFTPLTPFSYYTISFCDGIILFYADGILTFTGCSPASSEVSVLSQASRWVAITP